MSTTTKTLNFLHAENTDWLKRLDFYKLELTFLSARLEDAAALLKATDKMSKVEHFQNQFVIQKEQIDEISHVIRDHQNFLENNVNQNPTASDHRSVLDHPKLRDRVITFERLYNELRQEFYLFLSESLK